MASKTNSSAGFETVPAFLLFVLAFLAVALLPAFIAQVSAADSDALYKEADKAIRNSQRAMFNGKMEESRDLLNKAGELIEQIKAADPGYSRLKTLESKHAKQAGDLDRRTPKDAPKVAAPAAPEAPSPSAAPSLSAPAATSAPKPAAQDAKLPGGVTYRLRQVDKIIKGADRVLNKKSAASDEWRVKELESTVEQARNMMDDVQESYGDQIPPNHPEVVAREQKIKDFEAKMAQFKSGVSAGQEAAAQTEARKQAQSDEWVAKLRPYVANQANPAYDESKYLIAGAVEDPAENARRKAIYDEASALFDLYRNTEFPDGKTQELELVEKDMDYSLKSFAESHQSMSQSHFQQARQKLDNAAQWFQKEEEADDDKSQPKLLHKSILPEIERLIASAESAAPDDSRIPEMKAQLEDLRKQDAELRKKRVARTFMTPDKFDGSELDDVKERAQKALKEKHPGAKILRTTVISEDWKEERVLEHTDTTKTAVRYRVTRSVSAQIAAKDGGKVSLYTMYVGKDQRSDGSWGPLKSHVMFEDSMLEENVDR